MRVNPAGLWFHLTPRGPGLQSAQAGALEREARRALGPPTEKLPSPEGGRGWMDQ